jgi:hypothetical protein
MLVRAVDTVSDMRWTWLSSPAVALAGFLAAVITLMQWAAILARSIYRVTQADDKRQRISIWAARVSLAAVVALSALSWTAVHAVAVLAGNPGWQGALYPFMAAGCGIVADQALLVAFRKEQQFWLTPCALLILGLALQTGALYFHGGVAEWRRYVAPPILVLAVLPLVVIGRDIGTRLATRRSKRNPTTA